MKNRTLFRATVAVLAVAVITAAYFGQRFIAPGTAMTAIEPAKSNGAAKSDGAAKSAPDAPAVKAEKGGAGAAGGAVPVEVTELQPALVKEELLAVGSLRSNESVVLRPEVAGRVAQIGFRDGQSVRRGQLIVGLDAAVNQAEVEQARAEFELAQSNLKRVEDLARRNFVSSSAQEQAASNVEVSAAKLKLAAARLSKMRIVAPFDGVVGIRSVSVGDYVKDGTDLVNIEDVSQLKADFRLPERYLTQIRAGQAVEVTADSMPGERFAGTIDAVNPRIDTNGRSLEVRARLDNRERRLRPGMFVRVRVLVGERTQALLVPEEAIVPLGEDFYVFRVENGNARRIKVRTGVRRDAKVEIVEGLAAGDKVVTAGMRLTRDGQPVRIIAPSAIPTAAPESAGNEKKNEPGAGKSG